MRENWLKIVEGWDDYHRLGTVDKTQPIHKLVTKIIPDELREYSGSRKHLKHKGSTGQTRITMTPWVSSMDDRITTSAESGYYLVYLIKKDLDAIFLSFGVGVTQFDKRLKGLLKKKERQEKKKQVCEQIRTTIFHKIPDDIKEKMIIGNLPLNAATSDKSHKEYEGGGIFAFKYDLNSLPSDAQLKQDYLLFLNFYQDIVTDPIMPSMDDLLFSAYKEKVDEVDIVINFENFSKRQVKPSKKQVIILFIPIRKMRNVLVMLPKF